MALKMKTVDLLYQIYLYKLLSVFLKFRQVTNKKFIANLLLRIQ